MKHFHYRLLALAGALLALPCVVLPGRAQPQEAPPAPAPPSAPAEKVWPAGLERLAGTYRFLQVASPGGLWLTTTPREGKKELEQVSMSQLPRALRDRMEKAEIRITDLRTPTTIEASMEKSPGVGGMLRKYREEARGKLVMRGLPGIGGEQSDSGDYQGDILFEIDHTSLTEPTVSGVWRTRLQTEPTWGAATLDYASLTAMKPPKEGQEAAEPHYPIFNARILRSGMEIFAYIQWTDPEAKRKGTLREFAGTVRLVRAGDAPPN